MRKNVGGLFARISKLLKSIMLFVSPTKSIKTK